MIGAQRTSLRAVLGLAAFCAFACREGPPTERREDPAAFREAQDLLNRSRFLDAARRYALVRDSAESIGDTVNTWYGQLWWVESMTRAGQRDSARSGLGRAYALAGADRRRVGHTHVMASKVFERAGQLDSALSRASAAVGIASDLDDLDLGFRANDALGTALSLLGRYRQALAADSTSLAFRRALRLPDRTIAQGLNEVGIGYRHLGRYDDAVRVYEESFRLAAGAGDTLGMALARGNLAIVRTATGDRDAAIALLMEALRYVEAIGHLRFIVSANDDLGGHYLQASRFADARRHAGRALEVSRRIGQPYGEQGALLTLGHVDLAEGHVAEARSRFDQAMALADSLGFGQERVRARIGLVGVAIAGRDPGRARSLADAAVRIADSLGDPSAQFDALEARGRALEAARNPGAAGAFAQALDLLESMRGRLALGDLRMGVGEPRYGAYEGAIRVQLAAGRPDEALSVSERARARGLLEIMADRLGRQSHADTAVRARLREAWEARSSMGATSASTALDRQISRLTDSLAVLERRAPVPGTAVVAVRDMQRLATSDRALLSFFWGEKDVFAWWITPDTVRGVRLGSVTDLARTVDFLRGAIEVNASDSLWVTAGRRAFQDLIAPLGATSGIRQLVVIPDGPLHQLPFEVLIPAGSDRPLGATIELSYGPSGSVLAALAGSDAVAWSGDVFAVGNPSVEPRQPGIGQTPDRGRDATGAFAPLPYAEAEATAIARLFGADRSALLVGQRATVGRWLRRDPGRFRYLHFALHAVASDRRPETNGLLFAGSTLDLAAIRRLRLSADLVTLSACETGVGRWVRGEGIIGMQHAFLSAGARGVVVSLWRVADRAAADFMQEFYGEIRHGLSPSAALLRVRARWVAAGDERAQPWRWAAFIHVGLPAASPPATAGRS